MHQPTHSYVRGLIYSRTGLRDRDCSPDRLDNLILTRLSVLGLSSIKEYEKVLEGNGPASQAEFRALTLSLIPGETHFFRDKGQFTLLEKTILPRLIEERATAKSLRIWSAGCSTGDEAYSIAIALDSLILNRAGWDIEIRGTDINPTALDKARLGTYTDWSFRVIDQERKAAYFQRNAGQWVLKRRIRDAVRFSTLDLIHGIFPSHATGVHDVDLILCRNVFIYFEPDSIQRVLGKMTDALRPGGYLLTAHGELHGQVPAQMKMLSFPESSVYQKTPARGIRVSRPKEITPPPVQTVSPAREQLAAVLSPPFEQLARDCANKADYAGAEEWCQRALQEDPFAVKIYYLLAKIAEERKEVDRTKEMFKKVLYLDPQCVAAYLDLAAVYERENDSERARRLRLSALECLRHLKADAQIELYEGITPAELILTVEAMVLCQTS